MPTGDDKDDADGGGILRSSWKQSMDDLYGLRDGLVDGYPRIVAEFVVVIILQCTSCCLLWYLL